MALVGAAAGALTGAALIASPTAYATDPPPVPSLLDLAPPGFRDPHVIEDISFPYLYNFFVANDTYTIYDHADVLGEYGAKETGFVVGLVPVIGLAGNSVVVTDSTGAAPAVGTEWDGTALGLFTPQLDFYHYAHMSSPDGTSASLFEILGVGNYFSTGPTGTLDELGFFGTWVPVIDTPASAAMSTGLDMGDLGGLTDLGALWSDAFSVF